MCPSVTLVWLAFFTQHSAFRFIHIVSGTSTLVYCQIRFYNLGCHIVFTHLLIHLLIDWHLGCCHFRIIGIVATLSTSVEVLCTHLSSFPLDLSLREGLSSLMFILSHVWEAPDGLSKQLGHFCTPIMYEDSNFSIPPPKTCHCRCF